MDLIIFCTELLLSAGGVHRTCTYSEVINLATKYVLLSSKPSTIDSYKDDIFEHILFFMYSTFLIT